VSNSGETEELLHLLETLKRLTGRDLFAEAQKTNKSFAMFDKVNGTDTTRKAMQAADNSRDSREELAPLDRKV
jgi:hypothetical protein